MVILRRCGGKLPQKTMCSSDEDLPVYKVLHTVTNTESFRTRVTFNVYPTIHVFPVRWLVECSLRRYCDVLQSAGRHLAITLPAVVQPDRQRLAHLCSRDDPPSHDIDYDRLILSIDVCRAVLLCLPKQCKFVIVTFP